MALFGSGKDPSCRLQVLTTDYLIDGTTEISGQNLTSFTLLTDATVRSVHDMSVLLTGATLAIGEDTHAIIGMVPLDEQAEEELLARATTGKHELRIQVFTGPYVVTGTVLASSDDPKVLAQMRGLAVRDAQIVCVDPGSALGTMPVPAVLLYMNHLQGVVLTG